MLAEGLGSIPGTGWLAGWLFTSRERTKTGVNKAPADSCLYSFSSVYGFGRKEEESLNGVSRGLGKTSAGGKKQTERER